MTGPSCTLNVELPCSGVFELGVVKFDYPDFIFMMKFNIEWNGFRLTVAGTFEFEAFRIFSETVCRRDALCTLHDEDGGLIFTVTRHGPHSLFVGLRSENVLPYRVEGRGRLVEPGGSSINISPRVRILGEDEFQLFIEEVVMQMGSA